MCDARGNAVVVCSIENLDPMGVHTGDSWTVAPQQTLPDPAYQQLREAAFATARAVGVATGGANVQFAVHPRDGRAPRDRDEPARVALVRARVEGDRLPDREARRAARGRLHARRAAERHHAEDDRGVRAGARLRRGQGAAVRLREVPAGRAAPRRGDARRRRGARARADVRGGVREGDRRGARSRRSRSRPTTRSSSRARRSRVPERWDLLLEAARRGLDLPGIHPYFADRLREIATRSDERVTARRRGSPWTRAPASSRRGRRTTTSPTRATTRGPSRRARAVIVLGGGPNRIGQAIEFDYCCVHAAQALQKLGYEAVLVNSNPETVSTDYDTSDRLYLEPLVEQNVLDVCELERPVGVAVSFGGQTPLRLAPALAAAGVPLLGDPLDAIDAAEDRGRFARLAGDLAPEWGVGRERRRGARASPSGSATRCSSARTTCSAGAGCTSRARPTSFASRARARRPLPRGRARARRRRALRRRGRVGRGGARARRADGRPLGRLGLRAAGAVGDARRSRTRSATSATRDRRAALGARGLHQPAARPARREALRARGEPARVADGAVRRQGDRRAAGRARGAAAARRAARARSSLPERATPSRAWAKEAVFPSERFPGAATRGPEMRSTGEVMAGAATAGRGVRARASARPAARSAAGRSARRCRPQRYAEPQCSEHPRRRSRRPKRPASRSCVATVIDTIRSAPRQPGAKMVDPRGRPLLGLRLRRLRRGRRRRAREAGLRRRAGAPRPLRRHRRARPGRSASRAAARSTSGSRRPISSSGATCARCSTRTATGCSTPTPRPARSGSSAACSRAPAFATTASSPR